MYEYKYIVEDEVNDEIIQKNITNKNTILIFRLKDDFISQLTIDKLLEEDNEDDKTIRVVDVQLDHNSKVVGDFHLERLPKFYFYKKGKIVHAILGNASKVKLKRYILSLFLTDNLTQPSSK